MRPVSETIAPPELRIDFLFLDLQTCNRCRGTDRSLESALEAARELLGAAGARVEVSRIHVASAEQARALRFVSSPTIRIDGRDIALELRESSCGSEACTDGCGDSIACRVWIHRGVEYTEPPMALILDAILRAVYAGTSAPPDHDPGPFELPANLERFFAGRTPTAAERPTATAAADVCCSPAEQRSCCDDGDKAGCCGDHAEATCGCR